MKQFFKIIILFVGISILYPTSSFADKINSKNANQEVDSYSKSFYNKLDFKGKNRLNYETFQKAFRGYLNLREHGKLTNPRYLTICDFSLSSNVNRLWLIDIYAKKVVYNTLVAHGQGTGEEFATRFSNIPESHQSSLGFFVTSNTYSGNNGYSLRMIGVDGAYNSNALDRDIVIHGADYVSKEYTRANNRLGRSWGCPAVDQKMAKPLIDKIRNGSCLFIYHPTQSYLRSSYWLNNPIRNIPRDLDNVLVKADNEDDVFIEKTSAKDDFAPMQEPILEDKSITIVEYKDPAYLEKLKTEQYVTVNEITVPKDEVTPKMQKMATQRVKIVKKVNEIITVPSKK